MSIKNLKFKQLSCITFVAKHCLPCIKYHLIAVTVSDEKDRNQTLCFTIQVLRYIRTKCVRVLSEEDVTHLWTHVASTKVQWAKTERRQRGREGEIKRLKYLSQKLMLARSCIDRRIWVSYRKHSP